jgi:hypothetical protein
VEFQSFEEFWAALDRLDLVIAQMQALQRRTSARLAEKAKRKSRLGPGADLGQLGATIAALSAMVAKLVATNAANERRLKN